MIRERRDDDPGGVALTDRRRPPLEEPPVAGAAPPAASIVPAVAPCVSCPYRCDVPSGVWDESEYEKLPPYDSDTPAQPTQMFFCHQQDGRLCAGWCATHDMSHAISVRLAAAAGRLVGDDLDAVLDYTTRTPTFASGEEAAAHGMREIDVPPVAARRTIDRIQRKRKRR